MKVLKMTKTEFNFITVDAMIKDFDLHTCVVYFKDKNCTRQVYNELKNSEAFDDYNKVCIEDLHTLSFTGEVDIHYDRTNKILNVVSFT